MLLIGFDNNGHMMVNDSHNNESTMATKNNGHGTQQWRPQKAMATHHDNNGHKNDGHDSDGHKKWQWLPQQWRPPGT